jgi:orotidine-5'-phosphate decarboxylase
MTSSFKTNLQQCLQQVGTRLCIGIDPHFSDLPPFFQSEWGRLGAQNFLNQFCNSIIQGASGKAAVLKFQSAFFEAHGPQGFAALALAMKHAKDAGFFNILDAKRGDIASTMEAYGRMAFDSFGADALTVTPYMGFDVIAPLTPWLKEGRGIFIVWITSNPSGTAVQDLQVQTPKKISSMSEVLLDYIVAEAERSGLIDALGFVLGTTKINDLSPALLQKAQRFPLLLPGVGPQGGKIDEALKNFLVNTQTGLVSLSRGVCAFGDPNQKAAMHKLQSWNEYQNYVAERATAAAKALAILS